MRAEVMRLAKVVNDGDQCLILDCRGFHDPGKGSRWHLGLLPQNLQSVVDHRDFPRFLSDVRMNLGKLEMQEQTAPISIVCYCRKGAHRSTAVACILHHILMQTCTSATLLPIRHLSKDAGVWESDYCGECRQCRQFSFQRTAPRINNAVCRPRFKNHHDLSKLS